MWWVGFKRPRVTVYLGAKAAAVRAGDGPVAEHRGETVESSLAWLDAWARQSPRALSLDVWLSGALARPFLMKLPPDVYREKDRLKVAQALIGRTSAPGERHRVWLPSLAQRSSLSAFAPEHVLERLQAIARPIKGRRHHISAIRPLWVDALHRAHRAGSPCHAVALIDSDALTVLTGRDDDFDSASTVLCGSPGESQPALARALVSAGIEPGTERVERFSASLAGDKKSARSMFLETLQ